MVDATTPLDSAGPSQSTTTSPTHERLISQTPSSSSSQVSDTPAPNKTAVALRDNDPSKAETADSPTDDASPATRTGAKVSVADPEVVATSRRADGLTGPAEIDNVEEAKPSGWTRFRAAIGISSKSARVAAAAESLKAEQAHQRAIDPKPFRYQPYVLSELVDPKSVSKLRDMGGIEGIIAGLGTHVERGLNLSVRGADASNAGKDVENVSDASATPVDGTVVASPEDRERVYGRNSIPQKKAKSLWLLMWQALQDKILIILIIAAMVSLALGFYTDFGAPPEILPCDNPEPGLEGCRAPPIDWVEGLAILIAVIVVVTVGSANDYAKERQLQKLNAQKDERDVKVIRQGRPSTMSVHDVQVGDILQIEPGEVIPADGIFLRGHNVKCDESGATGESDLIKKAPYDECVAELEKSEKGDGKVSKRDPFLISGSRVQEGVGEYVVTAVGKLSFNGKLLMSLHTEAEDTPLQGKLNKLAALIAKLGSIAGLLLFIVLFIKFLAQLRNFEGSPSDKGQRFISVLILAVTVVVVAIPEGLPLAVTLALAFAARRMAKQNLLVRLLGSCETMGAATVICTDKTGTLTQNEMSVVAGSAGVHCKFVRRLQDHGDRVISNKTEGIAQDSAIDQQELSSVIEGPLRELWNDSIAVNSTAFEEDASDEADAASKKSIMQKITGIFSKDSSKKKSTKGGFVGSKTETALLSFAKDLGWEDYRSRRKVNETVTSYPFSSERKAMAVVVKKPSGGYRLMVKGASEVIAALCDAVVEIPTTDDASAASRTQVTTTPITEEGRGNLDRTIMFYANQTLRTLGLAYKDFESWPPANVEFVDNGDDTREVDYNSLARSLTLLSIVAIEDPLREGVAQAVKDTHTAGLRVIMVTGDNSLTARSIAAQCGIYDASKSPVIMEGPVFRTLNDFELREIVPRLAVLARSSPQDKQKLVETLKAMGEVVAVTGDGTNDAAALKSASIGFSMGIAGTEIAKEASDIILLDDRFSSIVTALLWGRCVRDAVRKFLQFQLAVNVGAVVITFVTSVASDEEESALTAVQLLWINLIMDVLASLALATDPASPELLNRKPEATNSPLISLDMWKMIIGQSLYQIALVLTLNFAGPSILNLHNPGESPAEAADAELELKALTFNVFVFCQLFNQLNARRLDRGLNIFHGFLRNPYFLTIMLIELGAQILIVFVGGAAFTVTRLGGRDWGISIIAGALSLPLGVLIRLIPTEFLEKHLVEWGVISDPNALPFDAPDAEDTHKRLEKLHWTEPKLGDLAHELDYYRMGRRRGGARGGRLAFLKAGWRHPSQMLREKQEAQKWRQDHLAAKRRGSASHQEGKNRFRLHPSTSSNGAQHNNQTNADGSTVASRFGALMPGLTAAGLAGAWRPQNPENGGSLADPAGRDPSISTQHLVRRGTNLVEEEQ